MYRSETTVTKDNKQGEVEVTIKTSEVAELINDIKKEVIFDMMHAFTKNMWSYLQYYKSCHSKKKLSAYAVHF